MAKIYETPVDVERERIAHAAHKERELSRDGFENALIGGIIATSSHTSTELARLQAKNAGKNASGFFLVVDKVLMWAGLGTGLIGVYQWLTHRGKAQNAEITKAALGSEQIVYPGEKANATRDCPTCHKHTDRLQQEVAKTDGRSL